MKHEQNEQVVIWLLNEFPYEAELLDTNIDFQPIDKEFLLNSIKNEKIKFLLYLMRFLMVSLNPRVNLCLKNFYQEKRLVIFL